MSLSFRVAAWVRLGLRIVLLTASLAFPFQNCSLQSRFAVSREAGTSYCSGGNSDPVCSLASQSATCLFDGQVVADGQSVTAFVSSTAGAQTSCQSQLRTCHAGALSGSYSYAACTGSGGAAASCLFDGRTVASGSSVTAYLTSTATGQACQSQSRVCTNGTLSGNFAYSSCQSQGMASCLFNGTTVPHGSSVTAFAQASVPSGQLCVSQVRTCYNGALSGSGDFGSCSVAGPATCQFGGRTLASGESVAAYASANVGFGQTCQAQIRTCVNGSLSGFGDYPTCVVDQPASCMINGQTIPHGGNITLYVQPSVPYGQTCATQQRFCSNGSLSGTATFGSCQPEAPPSCNLNGQVIASGQSVNAYFSSSSPTCTPEVRNCQAGTLSGTAGFSSCALADPPAQYPGIQYGNVTVTLDGSRGGQLASVRVAGRGETIVNDMDGRGIGTSGFLFDEFGRGGGLWNEGGCVNSGGNRDVVFAGVGTGTVTGTALTSTNWDAADVPCQRQYPRDLFQISHTIWFPSGYDGVFAVKQHLYNGTGGWLTPSLTNDGYQFPIAPQSHFDRRQFVNPSADAGYWRYRAGDGSWFDVPVARSPGWLDANSDFYHPAGRALAVFDGPGHDWGVVLYCPRNDRGFYAKDMRDFGILFIGSVWQFDGPLAPSASTEKTCYVIYGSEAVMTSVINGL